MGSQWYLPEDKLPLQHLQVQWLHHITWQQWKLPRKSQRDQESQSDSVSTPDLLSRQEAQNHRWETSPNVIHRKNCWFKFKDTEIQMRQLKLKLKPQIYRHCTVKKKLFKLSDIKSNVSHFRSDSIAKIISIC